MSLRNLRDRTVPAGLQLPLGLGHNAATCLWKATLTGVSALVLGLQAGAVQAGLMGPLLGLMQPQLENRLARGCQAWAGGSSKELQRSLEKPCRQLAGPTSRCLIEETERSGRSFAVMQELLRGEVGNDSTVVIKRCAARLLGLAPDSLKDVPLEELSKRFRKDPALTGTL